MAYVRGARRHPMFVLTITPEEEAQIETELGPYKRAGAVRQPPRGRPRQACGTVQAFWSHRKRKEQPCEPCSAAAAIYKAEYLARRAAS